MLEPVTGPGDEPPTPVVPIPRDPPPPPGYVDPLGEGDLTGDTTSTGGPGEAPVSNDAAG